MSAHSTWPLRLLVVTLATMLLVAACSGGDSTPTPRDQSDPGGTPTPGLTPSPTPEPVAAFAGYDLALEQGTFWTYQWEHTDGSCAQRSGCSSRTDDGEFRITLGLSRTIEGVAMFELLVSGDAVSGADRDAPRDFAPRWRYMGVDGNRIVVSSGATLTTLFDGDTGVWAGSGYFTDRFEADELVEADDNEIVASGGFSDFPGFRAGSAARVGRASGQSLCELIAGERICPREEAFNASENEHYRAGIGPLAYAFDFSFSFTGGGFATSVSTKERLALVATSLRGDALPTPTPSPTPPPAEADEREPNDSTAQAQQTYIGQTVFGTIAAGDTFAGPEVRATIGGQALILQAEDHYRFTMAQQSNASIVLELDSGASVGLVLWDDATAQVVELAYTPLATRTTISASLAAGTYRVGVIAMDTPNGRVRYTLSVDAGTPA